MHTLLNFLYNNKINSMLDIGANTGDFSQVIRSIFPNIKIFCIEANSNCERDLKLKNMEYVIECLSDTEKEINFFVSTIGDGKNTGASYFKELTKFYSDGNYIATKVKTKTLDGIFNKQEIYDFIKLDTQGSEIDIIKGGLNLIKRAKFLMIEMSIRPYNENAPLKDEVVNYLKQIGYHPIIKTEEHIDENGIVFQDDWIFENEIFSKTLP